MKKAEWEVEAKERFGDNIMNWKFRCPACGHIASVRDYKNAGAPANAVAYSCIGRYLDESHKVREAFGEGPGPCNYAGGGLFGLNPTEVDGEHYFEFAEEV